MRLRARPFRYKPLAVIIANRVHMGDFASLMHGIATLPDTFVPKRARDADGAAETYDMSTPDAPSSNATITPNANMKATLAAVQTHILVARLKSPTISHETVLNALRRLPGIVRAMYPGIEAFQLTSTGGLMVRFRASVEGNAMDAAIYRNERQRIMADLRAAAPLALVATAFLTLMRGNVSNLSVPYRLAGGGANDDALGGEDRAAQFPATFGGDVDFSMHGSNMQLLNEYAMAGVVAMFVASPNVHHSLQRRYGAGTSDVVTGVHQQGMQAVTVYFDRTNSGRPTPAAIVVPGVGRSPVHVHELLIGGRARLDEHRHSIVVPLGVDAQDAIDRADLAGPAPKLVAAGAYAPRQSSASIYELLLSLARTIYELFDVDVGAPDFDGWRETVTCDNLNIAPAERQRAINAINAFHAPIVAAYLNEWEQVDDKSPDAAQQFLANRGIIDFGFVGDVNDAVVRRLRDNYAGQMELYGQNGHLFSDRAIRMASETFAHPFLDVVMFGFARLRTTPITVIPPSSVFIAYTPPAEQDVQDQTRSYLLKPVVTSNCAVVINHEVQVYPNGGMFSLQTVAHDDWEFAVLPAQWLRSSPRAGTPLKSVIAPALGNVRFRNTDMARMLLSSSIVGSPSPNEYGGRLRAMDNTNIDTLRQAFSETMN